MRPSFNTTGPCIPGEHYMLPPADRLGRVVQLIEEGKVFTLHAGRQTGKTTCARWLVDHLNATGRHLAARAGSRSPTRSTARSSPGR